MHALKQREPILGDPSSWCDSACDRCPLLIRCPVGQAVSRRLHQMALEDGQETVVGEVTRDLNRALVMLEQACADEGIDPETLPPEPRPALAIRAEALGADLVRAASALTEAAFRAGGTDQASSSRLVGNSTLLAVKTTRIAWGLGSRDPEGSELLEPILLLIERTAGQLRGDARALAPFVPASLVGVFADAHGAMVELVTPWIAQVGAEARAELRGRIEAGDAPSPFCRTRAGGREPTH
jgi:hypothetical protein